MNRSRIVTGVDIGSFRTSAVMAEWEPKSVPRVIGVGTCASQGVRRGNLVDIEAAAGCVRSAVDKAEKMSGYRVRSAAVSVAGVHTSSALNSGIVSTGGNPGGIDSDDVDRVIDAAKNVSVPAGHGILHVLPREFVVDGYGGVTEPVGMAANRLETKATVVSCALSLVQNIIGCMRLAGLELGDLIVSPLASGESVLSVNEREIGTAVIDIGGGVTDFAVFREGALWGLGGLPIGGAHITNDIAIGLQVPVAAAEEIKIQGRAEPPADGEPAPEEIVQARVEEIFCLVRAELERSGLYHLIPGGAVLCGGTALLEGVDDCARRVLELPVRKGMPGCVAGLKDVVAEPGMAACVGLVHCVTQEFERDSAVRSSERIGFGSAVSKIRQWLSGLFA